MFIVTLVIGLLLGLWFGFSSNGMTSPRSAFNFYTVPTTAVIGVVLGGVVGLLSGALLATAFAGLLGGGIGGFVGLSFARIKRGGW
jgi:hypothetical protein